MKTLPAASTAMAWGRYKAALTAGPPSPEKPGEPLPATIVSTPSWSTFNTRWLSRSAIKRLPSVSRATPEVLPSGAWSAGTGWIGNTKFVPAIVVMMPCGRAAVAAERISAAARMAPGVRVLILQGPVVLRAYFTRFHSGEPKREIINPNQLCIRPHPALWRRGGRVFEPAAGLRPGVSAHKP